MCTVTLFSVSRSIFLRSKMAARRLEATAPANESQALDVLFFFTCWTTASRSIDVGASISCQLALANSFLSRMKLGLRYDQESENKKTSFPINNGEKFVEFKAGVQSSTDRYWGVLVRRSFKTDHLSGGVVYISLHSTMYTTIFDRQDTCWARFVWKDARPPLFVPATKWRKKITE